MIIVSVSKKLDQINYIEIQGHAIATQEKGKLVCAAVSGITFGILNALNGQAIESKVLKNKIIIKVLKNTEISKIILNTFYIQLMTIEVENKKYIKFKNK